jgi:outer membrane protein assembly factor BamB
VTADHQLIAFNAGRPQQLLARRVLQGLAPGDALVGIDFRVARGVLYALSRNGRLYTLDTATGVLQAVADAPAALALSGSAFGVDFNPVADRLRVVSDSGQNLRLHPDTGAVVDFDPNAPGLQPDPALAYAAGDANAGKTPQVVGAAYTYNQRDDKLTTNYAIDRALGALVTQGSVEGVAPVVSPNTGRLFTVGPLGLGPLQDASLDITDVGNHAFLAARTASDARTRLYRVDLASGRARLLGTIGDGAALRGLAVAP